MSAVACFAALDTFTQLTDRRLWLALGMLGGWLVFSHVPDGWSLAGIALIAVCGAAGAWLTVRQSRGPLSPAKA